MTTKRIVLIILCVLLAVMVVLFAVVAGRFAPVLRLLSGVLGGSTDTTGPVVTPPVTTAPSQTTTPPPVTTVPTTQPTEPKPTEPAHEHEYTVSKTVEAGCGTPGYTIYECTCGKIDIRDYVEGRSHSYSTGRKVAPTCEEQGYTEFICGNCGYSDKRNYIEPIGHDYQLVEIWEPECDHDGYELYRCTNCEDEKKENEVLAPGHVCEEWEETTPPGPGSSGEESGICTVCGEVVTRPCTLEIRAIIPENNGTYITYTVHVGTRMTNKAIVYTVIDYSCSNSVGFSYVEKGLVVKYNGVEMTTLQALQELTLTIDENGQMVVNEPEQPTDPTDPIPSEPSEPTEGTEE